MAATVAGLAEGGSDDDDPEGTASGAPCVTGEARPYYLFHPAVPDRMHADLPDAKWIVLLWDPVARALSWYYPRRSCWRVTLEGIMRQD